MLFTIGEIIDLIIMVFAIGFIFSTFIKKEPDEEYDPINFYKKNSIFENFKYATIIAAPAIVFHELAHKFTAMAFGATATLHAPIDWYIIAIVLRLINAPIFFLVGGYVSHTRLPFLESAIVSISGPLTNLIFYTLSILLVKFKLVKRKYYKTLAIIGKLNLFLFIFNMIPFPGFDGFNFILNLFNFFKQFF
ncbi:MAG: hypothetical protein QXE31_04640 [Candidatus Woesearchaeota archaeon]